MVSQVEFSLNPVERGFHLVTEEIISKLPQLPKVGLLNIFIKHTSAALTINENEDPYVQIDLDAIFDRLFRERESYYMHTLVGDDDTSAHAKTTVAGVSLNIPITEGKLNLGQWQGIFLCEFHTDGGRRQIVATIMS